MDLLPADTHAQTDYAIPTRVSSARQLTTGHCHALPTRASQSDQLSLPSRWPPDPSTPTTVNTTNTTNLDRLFDTSIHLRPYEGPAGWESKLVGTPA